MAFFGVTAAGPQNAFQAASAKAADLAIFREADFERAFHRVCKTGVRDGREVDVLMKDESDEFMREVFMGDYPPIAERRLHAALDARVGDSATFEELLPILRDLAEEDEVDVTKKGGRHLQEEGRSAGFLRERLARGVRPLDGPRDELFQPLTAAQEVGWDMTKEDVIASREEIIPTRKCEETKFAAHLFATGEFL